MILLTLAATLHKVGGILPDQVHQDHSGLLISFTFVLLDCMSNNGMNGYCIMMHARTRFSCNFVRNRLELSEVRDAYYALFFRKKLYMEIIDQE